MFKRILVPLDGSSRAERALAVAARIARAADGAVILMQTVGIQYAPSMYGPYTAQTPMLAEEVLDVDKEKVEEYIDSASRSPVLEGVKVDKKVVVGTAAVAIQDLAREEAIDLIVMCSHGNTGFKRWALGSVTQRVSRTSQVPVLALREDGVTPDSEYPDPLRPLRSIIIMIALDGSEFAEAAITPAAALVAALAAPTQGMLLFTRAVPLSALGNTPATKELALEEARSYLREVMERYAGLAEKLKITLKTAVVTGKEVAHTLIQSAEHGEEVEGKRLTGNCDLIAITTHGRGGLQRLAMGSVTEAMLGATKLPLLVVHSDVQSV